MTLTIRFDTMKYLFNCISGKVHLVQVKLSCLSNDMYIIGKKIKSPSKPTQMDLAKVNGLKY